MPEMTFVVEWPDGSLQKCYSPSLVMHDYLSAHASYPLQDFVSRVDSALDEASRRVQEKYGFACTSAAAQKASIHDRAKHFASVDATAPADIEPVGSVRVLSMEPPLPVTTTDQGVSS